LIPEITAYLGHEPTEGQLQFFQHFEAFLQEKRDFSAFILKGYAGTGKTSTMKALIKLLPHYKLKSILLAPTGRAAKVLSEYTGKQASTIHKKIYRRKSSVELQAGFLLTENKHRDTLFIVDESSMIAGSVHDTAGIHWSKDSLLDDLIKYVYESDQNCKILFVGDTAQLPPVGSETSPALNAVMLEAHYGLKIFSQELTEVVRQEKASGILYNATHIRKLIAENKDFSPKLICKGFTDFYSISGEKLEDGLQYAYHKYGIEDSLVICRSNKNANNFNQAIRARILFREEEISAGDYLMVVKNNYFWLPEEEQGFIANGELLKVSRVRKEEEIHGFRFAEATVQLIDLEKQPSITVKILLSTLTSESPALTQAEQKQLFESVSADYADIPNKRERLIAIKADPYYNALQIKFSYAVTCHKAQGGQWKAIFIDQGYITDELMNSDFLRWLYTAITRAQAEVFLVNFHPKLIANG
jgi:exodeoxyribonuclease-5